MALSESVATSLVYKAYATGVISAAEPVPATDPGTTGGQTLRRVRASVNLEKTTFQSAEINSTRQVSDFRHGTRKVMGQIAGELSGGSYWDFIVAAFRDITPSGTFTALTQATYTSVTPDASAGTLTLGASDPVATGQLRVGDVIALSGLTAGNAVNNGLYTCVAFGGTTNRTITVMPAPALTSAAQTTFSITRQGRSTIVPSTGHVQRKFAIEVVDAQLDQSRLMTETRINGMSLSCPSEGMTTVSFDVAGRNSVVLTGAASPFFTAPTGQSTTGIMAAANGALRMNGQNLGVVTGIDIAYKMDAMTPSIIGGSIVPDILLGVSGVTGTVTAFVTDSTLLGLFANETSFEIIVSLPASDGSLISVYLPRVKLSGASIDLADGPQTISMPFTALLGTSTANGAVATTIKLHDSTIA